MTDTNDFTVEGDTGVEELDVVENVATETTSGSDLQDSAEEIDRKSTRLNSSHSQQSRMPSSA